MPKIGEWGRIVQSLPAIRHLRNQGLDIHNALRYNAKYDAMRYRILDGTPYTRERKSVSGYQKGL